MAKWIGLTTKKYPSIDEKRSPRHQLIVPKSIFIPLLEKILPFLILKKRQAEIILEIEVIRAKSSPSRSLPMGEKRRMPLDAIEKMNILHIELRSLKSNKRPGSKGWQKPAPAT